MANNKTTTTRQKKLGPAPFASFEDLSEDLSSPESKGYQPMPEICEERNQQTDNNNDASASTSTAQTPTTPRIDVEQASSPSQAESGDSTPERELFGLDMAADNLTSAFLEGAADVDLRSSASEEMGGIGPFSSSGSIKGRNSRNTSLLATGGQGKSGRKISWDAGDVRRGVDSTGLERKGSGRSSNSAAAADPFFFPCRDTRLSSISSNVSATSGMSGLSAFSGRRSPSPHRMQLETSFCGPKTVAAAAAKEAEEEEELLDLEASRRPSLLNPPSWFGGEGGGSSRCASPLGTPSSPGCMRSFMFKYATEPRSRPTSPSMGWNSAAPSPGPSLLPITGDSSVSSRWLASPRCQRRASSPHRTLVETSFCGHMQIKVPEDEVAPRGPSPMPSLGSLLSIQSQAVKYTTEPRSRPASPTASRSFFSLTPIPADSRRGSATLPGGQRCPSPMIETSFCGPKRLTKRDSEEEMPARAPSSMSTRPSDGHEEAASLRPVRYATEPRSRPVSPGPGAQPIITTTTTPSLIYNRTDSPIISRSIVRSPSPARMRVETSFCGAKQQLRQDSIAGQNSGGGTTLQQQQLDKETENFVTEVSIHPLPVKYATEPRSRPVSPCSLFSNNCPTPDRRRSPSPHRMVVETSFYSSALNKAPSVETTTDTTTQSRPPPAAQQPSSMSVKYATEPRSRPVSPNPAAHHFLGNHSPNVERRLRSPSPHRMQVETSFCGPKQVARQSTVDNQVDLVQAIATRLRGSQEEGADDSSNSSVDSVTELPSNTPNHFDDRATMQSNSSCSLLGAVGYEEKEEEEEEEEEEIEFPTSWPDQPVSQFAAEWPVHHLKTFELSPMEKNSSSSEEATSPPSQHSNGHVVAISRTPTALASSSPVPARPGRHMPKPVACPKPPQSFHPQSGDSSAQSSPLASPALSRRVESASPSPSSPFPSRRTSLGGTFRPNQVAEETATEQAADRKSSGVAAATKSGELSADESPSHPPEKDKKGGSRSVLSVLFGKRSGKNKNKDREQDVGGAQPKSSHRNGQQQEVAGSRMLSLPLPSRDSSPAGRSVDSGQSGDDLDDGEGFQHQVLETGNESGDNLVESELLDLAADNKGGGPLPAKEELSFFHQDSLEEELPFVPTTLPIERPIAPLITPVRMRMSELKMTPIQRPRCSISFGPSSINDYVKIARADSTAAAGQQGESSSSSSGVVETPKIKVSLPKPEREESVDDSAPPVPPIKVTVGSVCSNWEAFSEQVFVMRKARQGSEEAAAVPGPATQPPPTKATSQWINVEELPEPVKEPKAIKVVKTGSERRETTATAPKEEEEDAEEKMNLELPVRKDSVSSETALLREIEEAEFEEDRSPPQEDEEDDEAVSIREERHSQSSR